MITTVALSLVTYGLGFFLGWTTRGRVPRREGARCGKVVPHDPEGILWEPCSRPPHATGPCAHEPRR